MRTSLTDRALLRTSDLTGSTMVQHEAHVVEHANHDLHSRQSAVHSLACSFGLDAKHTRLMSGSVALLQRYASLIVAAHARMYRGWLRTQSSSR